MRFKEIQLSADGLKETKPHEWLIRFVFGGVVSLMAGIVGRHWGPVVGGLFLGFPSILPATVTLVTKHKGRQAAADDTRGAAIGSVGLVGFAVIVFVTAESWSPWASLGAAIVGWALASLVAWRIIA